MSKKGVLYGKLKFYMYTEFDYKKVLAILKQLSKDAFKESDDYVKIQIVTFEDEDQNNCFDALENLHSYSSFAPDGCFSLIYASCNLGVTHDDWITFTMSETECTLSSNFLVDVENEKIFKEVIAIEDLRSDYWQAVLSDFICKIRIIVKHKLRIFEGAEEMST